MGVRMGLLTKGYRGVNAAREYSQARSSISGKWTHEPSLTPCWCREAKRPPPPGWHGLCWCLEPTSLASVSLCFSESSPQLNLADSAWGHSRVRRGKGRRRLCLSCTQCQARWVTGWQLQTGLAGTRRSAWSCGHRVKPPRRLKKQSVAALAPAPAGPCQCCTGTLFGQCLWQLQVAS